MNKNPNLFICKSARPVPEKFINAQWIQEQKDDPDIGQFLILRNEKNKAENLSEDVKTMLRKKSKYIIRNNLLYRKCESTNHDTKFFQFVLPKVFRKQALESLHDEIGHLGIERKRSLLKDRFLWPNMDSDIENYVKSCPSCLKI